MFYFHLSALNFFWLPMSIATISKDEKLCLFNFCFLFWHCLYFLMKFSSQTLLYFDHRSIIRSFFPGLFFPNTIMFSSIILEKTYVDFIFTKNEAKINDYITRLQSRLIVIEVNFLTFVQLNCKKSAIAVKHSVEEFILLKTTLMQIWKSPFLVHVHIKIIPWKFHILSPKNYWVTYT